MQARRASRELALILFSQLDRNMKNYEDKDFDDIILKSVRTLTSNAQEELNLVASDLFEIKEYIDDYEINHPDNLERPIGAENLPIKFELTDVMSKRIGLLTAACEKTASALEIAEITTLSEKAEVKEYVQKIANAYKANADAVDDLIKRYAVGWDIERIFRIDKNILRIAISEFVFIKEAPMKVIVDEAVELAKKYSTDDSSSFINGIMARIVGSHV